MAKMNEKTFQVLYEYGKKVYKGELTLNEAAKKAHEERKEVAESSAKHYITWYSRMRDGSYLTWNTNAQLLLYYVSRIIKEEGTETGKVAISSARKYAERAGKDDISAELDKIAETYHIFSEDVAATFVKENENKDAISLSAGGEKTMTAKSMIHDISNYITSHGFTYPEGLIENFYLCLRSKPFVILAGTSGTGKTKLVKLFAEAVGATSAEGGGNGRYKLVSVRPDWSDSSDLFGHVNLKGEFIPGAIIDFIDRAIHDIENPYFLCLDEMNLARVEYYLSDFLSLMETRRKDNGKIITDGVVLDEAAKEKYEAIYLPENLYIIGTVNMDETTFPFSKKVLDRANTIEFNYVDLIPKFDSVGADVEGIQVKNDFLRAEYFTLARDCSMEKTYVKKLCEKLQELNNILGKANAHVGYRVRDEIVFYMLNNKKSGFLLPEDQAFDNEIMQKILPRIQGDSEAIKSLLVELFKFCMNNKAGIDANTGHVGEYMKSIASTAKYPASATKIGYMMTRHEEDGFTSYWL